MPRSAQTSPRCAAAACFHTTRSNHAPAQGMRLRWCPPVFTGPNPCDATRISHGKYRDITRTQPRHLQPLHQTRPRGSLRGNKDRGTHKHACTHMEIMVGLGRVILMSKLHGMLAAAVREGDQASARRTPSPSHTLSLSHFLSHTLSLSHTFSHIVCVGARQPSIQDHSRLTDAHESPHQHSTIQCLPIAMLHSMERSCASFAPKKMSKRRTRWSQSRRTSGSHFGCKAHKSK